jgi:predicted CoA-substrate-specific enzyme activase
MRYTAAIDLGSGFTKAVILASDGASQRIIGKGSARSGADFEAAARSAMAPALEEAGLVESDVHYVATTGFGRYGFSARDTQITEITSAACGAHFLFPSTSVVLDIGSQCTRAVAATETGRVRTFKTNDKCAAGSGSFIARAAKYLEVPLDAVGSLALQATRPQPISSVCAVLAESEIINLVSSGTTVEDIFQGIYDSLAERAGLLLRRVGLGRSLTFIGGVARQKGMVRALESRLRVDVHVPEGAEYVCAIGAAVLAQKRLDVRVAQASSLHCEAGV